MPRFAAVSPDGRQVVFETLGRLYVRDAGRRRAAAADRAGRRLRALPGLVARRPHASSSSAGPTSASARSAPSPPTAANLRTVTQQPGHYRRPRFSPDGATIVFEQGGGGGLTSDRWSDDDRRLPRPRRRRRPTRIARRRRQPAIRRRLGPRLHEVSEQQKRKLISADLGGGNRRDHAQGEMVTDYEVSPDGRTLAFRQNYKLFVMPFFGGAATLDVGARGSRCRSPGSAPTAPTYPLVAAAAALAWSLGPDALHAPTPPTCCAPRRAAAYSRRRPPASRWR